MRDMEFTGERYVPGVHGPIELEHLHRYLLASRIAAGKVVLDIASGEGYGAGMLAVHASQVIGVDISNEAIEHARAKYRRDNLRFCVGSCAEIPVADSSVDLVVSFETLEHHDQHDRMMQEIKRVLRPNGVLLLSTPDKQHYAVGPSRLNPFHVKELYREDFEKLLSKYFANSAYFSQKVVYGSGIFSGHTSPPLDSYVLSKDVIRHFSGLSEPTYWIGVVSDGPLADLTSSFLEQPLDEMEIVRERDAEIGGLHRELVQRAEARTELQESLLAAAAFTPLSLNFPNSWVGHLPFAAWLVKALAPPVFVELGTHSGNSFFTFCQAVAQSGAPTRCYAVDTWQGDEHAGRYDESIFAKVSAYHQLHYSQFARLLRMTFDEALDYFSDGSVHLLHVDGLHTYDAVRHDFETWLPKLAPGAVVLFHDTNVRERGFAVWKLWEELQSAYPLNLEFVHSHGLGVMQLNNAPDGGRLPWLEAGSREKQMLIDFFASLGSKHLDHADALELRAQLTDIQRRWVERDAEILYRDGQIAALSQQLAERDDRIAKMAASRSWRLTSPLRRITSAMRSSPPVHDPVTAGATSASKEFLASLFDAAWYLEKNPDVQAAGLDPLRHFLDKGGFEGRNPHPLFDAGYYLDKNPDVRAAGMNPLEHFARDGWKEGRQPHPLFDVRWYLDHYPDVKTAGINPLQHFIECGGLEGRTPHPLFDATWYLETYPDVRNASINPLVHFLEKGWTEGRRPNPSFDLPWYLEVHADVRSLGMNPLRHYVEYGAAEGRPFQPTSRTEPGVRGALGAPVVPPVDIAQYLPQGTSGPMPPSDVAVDVIVPVYRGFEEVKRCLNSLLADTLLPMGHIRVIDDCSPDAELTSWLSSLAATGAIQLSRNQKNLGFVRTVNRGMSEAGRHDVVLLNSDTEVAPGFLRRLAGHAYSTPRVATVTPFSNTGGEMCGFPDTVPRPLPDAYPVMAIDRACEEGNGARSVDIPTGVGYCLYVRRAALDDVGGFDVEAFGRGYGEETDFCQRALAKGWRHLLACNTFVYHVGEVSFGQNAPERLASWNTLVSRYPGLPGALRSHLAGKPNEPAVFAATVALFRASPLPTVLIVNHRFDDGAAAHVDDLMNQIVGTANVLALTTDQGYLELSVPSIQGHPTLKFPPTATPDLSTFLHACSLSRVHMQHWIGIGSVLHELIDQLGVPTELTVHDYLSA